jgi:NDP-sugar pyrophosphorylase family protein
VKAGIIAAGDGARFVAAGIDTPKPLLRVAGVPLVERTVRQLVAAGVSEIALIVNERMPEVARVVQGLDLPVPVHTVIQTTDSSMHSLYHLQTILHDDRFVLCTVDSIVLPNEFSGFVQYFVAHPRVELLLSYTDFVDDEKPLYIGVDEQQRVTALGQDAEASPFVTVGLYGMSPAVFVVIEEALRSKVQRLRNLLGLLLRRGVTAKGFRLSKAVDVDRPEDVIVAESFLGSVSQN